MVLCLGTEGSNGSLFRNGWFQCFLVQELKVPKVPYLEMGGSNVFPVSELKVPMVPYLEMGGSNVFLFRDRKSVVQGKSVDLGGRRIIKKKKHEDPESLQCNKALQLHTF